MRRRKTNNVDDIFEVAYNWLSQCLPSPAVGFNVKMRDSTGQTLLHRAVVEGSTCRVKALIGAGVDVNALDSNEESALITALRRCDINTVQTLINAGADVHAQCKGFSVLGLALKLYLPYWRSEDEDDEAGADKFERIVTALLAAGVDPNARDANMTTPLHDFFRSACKYQNFPCRLLELLLASGGNPDDDLCLTSVQVSRPICLAVLYVNIKAVQLLLQYNCSLNWNNAKKQEMRCAVTDMKPVKPCDFQKLLAILNLLYIYGSHLHPILSHPSKFVTSWHQLTPSELSDWSSLRRRVSDPFPLSVLAVSVIRSRMPRHLASHVIDLNLPITLQNYVAAQNL